LKIDDNKKNFYATLDNLYESYAEMKMANYDIEIATIFFRKSNLIKQGVEVEPESAVFNVEDRILPYRSATISEIEKNREKMMFVLGNEAAKTNNSVEAARLQFFFDCWILEEKLYTKFSQMVRCKRGFLDTLTGLEIKLSVINKEEMKRIFRNEEKKIIKKPKTILPNERVFYVYFNFDSSAINERGSGEIWKILKHIKSLKANYSIKIYGHTDRVGDSKYNDKLSSRRTGTVKQYLIKNDVSESRIEEVKDEGEYVPTIITNDNDKEVLNRRVDVIVETKI
jgi:outer membrane protein OmpA-like peptidoglycan-associated protein